MNIQVRNATILERFNYLIGTGKTTTDAVSLLATEFNIGKLYTKSILKSMGVELKKKKTNVLSDRDKSIIKMAEEGYNPETISAKFGITPTRVRQVIRGNVSNLKSVKLENILTKIKTDVQNGVAYKDIQDKYDKKVLGNIKSNLGYNLFKACQARRDTEIVRMGRVGFSASETAEKVGLCQDYIYAIWNNNGIKKNPRPDLTPEQRAERNNKIREAAKTTKLNQIAREYGLSPTMVKIIVNNEEQD